MIYLAVGVGEFVVCCLLFVVCCLLFVCVLKRVSYKNDNGTFRFFTNIAERYRDALRLPIAKRDTDSNMCCFLLTYVN